MKRRLFDTILILLVSVLMTACGKSYDFSQMELTEAIGVKREVFDEMNIQPADDGDTGNELMEQAVAMMDAGFYSYSFAHDGSETDFDVVKINFVGGKVGTVCVSAISLKDLSDIPSEYSIFGIRAGDSVSDAKAKAEAHFGEKGSALSDDKAMFGLTDGDYDYITYGDFSGSKGYMQIITDIRTDTVISVEYSKY